MFSSWVMRNWGQGLGQVHTTGWRTGFTTLQKVLFLRAWHRGKKGGPEGRWFFSVMISFVNLSRVSGLLFLANKFVQHIWLGTVFKFSFIKIKVKRRSYCFCVCPVHSYSSKRWWPLAMFAFQTLFLVLSFLFCDSRWEVHIREHPEASLWGLGSGSWASCQVVQRSEYARWVWGIQVKFKWIR